MDVDLKLNEHCLRQENTDQQNAEFQELTSKKIIKNVEEDKENVCNKKAKNGMGETTKPKKNSFAERKREAIIILNPITEYDILNAGIELNGNGKSIKSRLEGKVPSTILTNQIVSKQENANVILERYKERNTQKVYESNTLFDIKLTKLLANRISPLEMNSATPLKSEENSSKMQTSELLAILEGSEKFVKEDIHQVNALKTVQSNVKEKEQKPEIKKNPANLEELPENEFVEALEQQLALKQLEELNLNWGNSKTRITPKAIYKRNAEASLMEKLDVKKVKFIQEAIKESAKQIRISNLSDKTVKSEIGSSSPQKTYVSVSATNIDDKEPKFKTNVPFKTYTRKRKLSEELPAASEMNKSIITDMCPSILTMIESSRITKQTISWDSDESSARLTEADKLLMDESAVNTLYAAKNIDEQNVNKHKKKKSNVISQEEALSKELLNKTNKIEIDLQTNTTRESPKSLRKKESPPITPKKIVGSSSINRQKSRVSVRSSIQSSLAPPSSSGSFSSVGKEKFSTSATNENKGTERITESKSVRPPAEPQKIKKTTRNTRGVEEKLKTNEELSLIETDSNNFVEMRYYDLLIVRKRINYTEIIIQHNDEKVLLNGEIMDAICLVLIEASEDSECNAVLINSSGNSFCHGLDYKALICVKEQTRETIAKELAIKVCGFLKCLANFPKVLVCGVQGAVEGFGVMMLPLFDLIIASETATFTTQYGRLGCVPEGSSILTLTHVMHNGLLNQLLYESRKLIAAEALRIGLVTRVILSHKFEEELSSTVKTIAKQSSQFTIATKKILRQNMLRKLNVELKLETDILVKYWTSNECQKNFSLYS